MASLDSLAEYARRLLSQGYSPPVVRAQIVSAGYSPVDANNALKIAGYTFKKTFAVSFKTLAFFLGGLVLVFLAVFAYKLLQPKPFEAAFDIALSRNVVEPAGSFEVASSITSTGKKASASITYELVDAKGSVKLKKTASAAVDSTGSSRTMLVIPAGLSDGSYALKARMVIGGKTLSDEASVTVRKKEAVVEKPGLVNASEKILPVDECGNCDDLDESTEDLCITGRCVHNAKAVFCGNQKCEPGETVVSCPADCRTLPPDTGVPASDEKIRAAEALAASNPEQAARLCNTILDRFASDDCFGRVAKLAGKSEMCSPIGDASIKDDCLVHFALSGDYAVCKSIQNDYLRSSCYSLQSMQG